MELDLKDQRKKSTMDILVEQGKVVRLENGEHVTRGAYDLAIATGTVYRTLEQCKKDSMAREKRMREFMRAQSD